LAGALDFGVIETAPENRDQLEIAIPGFPTTEITHPNIRFQQKNNLPDEMKRTDSVPISYEKKADGTYKPKVSAVKNEREWSLNQLSTRENPLVVFTLISQAVVGAFITLFVGPVFGLETLSPSAHPVAWPVMLFGLIALQTLALILSTLHLGRPHRFYRAFNNLRYSPVSREVAGIAVFYNFLGAFTLMTGLPMLFEWLPQDILGFLISVSGWGATISGITAIYFMHSIYRIPARPFWDHWQTLSSFYGNVLTLGPLCVLIVYAIVQHISGAAWGDAIQALALLLVAGIMIESIGLCFHASDLMLSGGEGAASYHEQTTKFGNVYMFRNVGLILGLFLAAILGASGLEGIMSIGLWSITAIIITTIAVISRTLFYALVIPTTMPGAFFWKNKSFEDHARETGLAKMPQVGVLADTH
jgi:DMSO reductase anchor subunit